MTAELLRPNPVLVLPFVALLGAIALGPLVARRWWERHYAKVAFGLGAITLLYYVLGLQAHHRVLHTGHEYASFIILIGSLFVVSGGIHIRVKGEATPHMNTLFLLLGAVLANLFGTTGASMLLIRPWIQINRYRITGHHIIFFIFIVSNVGGLLTPVGDPPLFLGYLKGIPFWWLTQHAWMIWLVAVGYLLGVFYVLDSINFRRAPGEVRKAAAAPADSWRFEGLWNLLFLAVILGAVFIENPPLLREIVMVTAATASWFTTRKQVHEGNHFNFQPLRELAILFAGIFATMMPALDWLQVHSRAIHNPTPGMFYWGTGLVSSCLDNAPTYLGFLSAAFGSLTDPQATQAEQIAHLLGNPNLQAYVLAISVAAVFFGACTYIGNGPNFMVKAIADHQHVHTPGFVGMVWKYTLPVLAPMLILIWLLFFKG